MRAAEVVEVATPQGPGRFFVAEAHEPRALLVLGHGAGGGVDAPDLVALASRLPEAGVSVLRFEQPWRTAGRRVAVRPPLLDEAWLAALGEVREALGGGLPLVTGGRSAGARVACRTADVLGVAGVVCLAFPLHLPGRPERSRLPELLAPSVPRLVLQGTRDTFGSADEIMAALRPSTGSGSGASGAGSGASGAGSGATRSGDVRVVPLPGADHGFRVVKGASPGAAELRHQLVGEVEAFVAGWAVRG